LGLDASLGKQVGSNLFHSFGKFGLSTGESATFGGPATVSNVIGRVTGGAQSSIDGKIASTITGANLYLINPSGIVFGPNATVNVSGSFHASTADYVKMSDGAKFQATNPDGSTLSAAPPAAFGFLTAQPAAVTVGGSTLGPVPGTLGLVAGPVSITSGAALFAPAGTIHVVSVAGTGEVPNDPRNTVASTVTSFGPVNITGNSTLDISDAKNLGSGGSVFVRGGALTIDASEINADNYGAGPGGVLSLRGDNQITLSNGANVHSGAMGSGSGADVLLSTASSGIILMDAATVMTDSLGSGRGGSISIVAGQLALHNLTNVLAQSSGPGPGGDVVVSVGGPMTVDSGASLGTIANADGNAGNVFVTAAGPVTIDMSVGAAASTLLGIASQTQGQGNAGNITVTGGALSILHNGEIASLTNSTGNAGSVIVTAFEKLTIDGSGGIPPGAGPTGIFSQAVAASGNAGVVSVAAGTLSVVNSGKISTSTSGSGNAGDITVAASGQLTVDNSSGDPNAGATGIFSQAVAGTGAAGVVNVSASTLSIVNSGEIAVSTFSSGNAGSVTVTALDKLTIDGSGENLATGRTGIFSQGNPESSGAAGTVTVNAATLILTNDGAISSGTLGLGNGGNIALKVRDFLHLVSGEITTSVRGETGNGGNIIIDPQLVILEHSSSIIAQAIEGHGGNIMITADQFIPSSDSFISATSQRGVSGTVVINGVVNANGALVVLSTQLRRQTEVLREACESRTGRPLSSLVEAGRGGLPPDPEANLPALYIAGRDLSPTPRRGTDTLELSGDALRTMVRVTMRCG
jgi:filamentous hemagglutinin family protein